MADEEELKPQAENALNRIDEVLVRTSPQLFQDIPKAKRQEMVKAVVSITKIHSGPLPPVELIRGYEEIYPGSAKLIFDVFEKQANHRIKMEDTVITSSQRQSGRGQILAFIIAILFLGVATWVTLAGHDVVGGILGGVDIVGLVTVFVLGKKEQRSNLDEKNPGNKAARKKK